MAERCNYSCESAAKTLEWIKAISDFIRPYTFLSSSHVVNFFQDRLWEAVDKEWIDCLRNEPVENLLLIPSGIVQDYWPTSLKKFVSSLRSLVFPQEQVDLQKEIPGLHMIPLNTVVTQGMNLKKKHEVEVLSAIVSSVATSVKAETIVDIGSGQGYLAQVLSFQYDHSVVAIDASSHHGKITDGRAERIKKYYLAQMRKSESGKRSLSIPKTVTCHVISTDILKYMTGMSLQNDDGEHQELVAQGNDGKYQKTLSEEHNKGSLVLAGLHACGDLSVTMIRAFLECFEVKAVVSIGCCYNLLSEQGFGDTDSQYGFPMSCGVKTTGMTLGKNARDLACQSAERWRNLEKDAGLNNFELHAFRAAFQMVLCRYYPEVIMVNPSIGRQGKALRRQQQKRMLEASLHHKGNNFSCESQRPVDRIISIYENGTGYTSVSPLRTEATNSEVSSSDSSRFKGTKSDDKYSLFESFCQTGLSRLGLNLFEDINFHGIWKDIEPFIDLIGPYWSLRAALGPLLETLILLDRLLFLQEQGRTVEVSMLPIFDPVLSPRNVAIIAKKSGSI